MHPDKLNKPCMERVEGKALGVSDPLIEVHSLRSGEGVICRDVWW